VFESVVRKRAPSRNHEWNTPWKAALVVESPVDVEIFSITVPPAGPPATRSSPAAAKISAPV
jgi:hypothetical protein